MIVCPVCEHQQVSGDECDNCGKRLGGQPALATAVPRMQALEPTALVRAGIPVEAPRMSELEATRLSQGVDLPAVRLPDMEPTAGVAAGEVAVQTVPELERGRLADDGARTAIATGAITCRYCGNAQVEGHLCDRCGMKLPRAGTAGRPSSSPRAGAAEGDFIRCPKCAMPARIGKRCVNCGAEVEAPP